MNGYKRPIARVHHLYTHHSAVQRGHSTTLVFVARRAQQSYAHKENSVLVVGAACEGVYAPALSCEGVYAPAPPLREYKPVHHL